MNCLRLRHYVQKAGNRFSFGISALYSDVSFDMMRRASRDGSGPVPNQLYPVVGFPSDHKGADCKSAVIDFKVRLERQRESVAIGNDPKGEEQCSE